METNTLEREVMRFILNGRTFDTATSTPLAVSRFIHVPESRLNYTIARMFEGDWDQVRGEETLYRTAKGALFVHRHSTMKFPKGKPVVKDEAREVATPEDAVRWIQDERAAILDASGLPLPDAA